MSNPRMKVFRFSMKVPVTSLKDEDLSAFMKFIGYGGPSPAYAQRCRDEVLQDPARRAWDPVHGEFLAGSDGALYAAFDDIMEELQFAVLSETDVDSGEWAWKFIPHDDPHWARLKRCYARFNK